MIDSEEKTNTSGRAHKTGSFKLDAAEISVVSSAATK